MFIGERLTISLLLCRIFPGGLRGVGESALSRKIRKSHHKDQAFPSIKKCSRGVPFSFSNKIVKKKLSIKRPSNYRHCKKTQMLKIHPLQQSFEINTFIILIAKVMDGVTDKCLSIALSIHHYIVCHTQTVFGITIFGLIQYTFTAVLKFDKS